MGWTLLSCFEAQQRSEWLRPGNTGSLWTLFSPAEEWQTQPTDKLRPLFEAWSSREISVLSQGRSVMQRPGPWWGKPGILKCGTENLAVWPHLAVDCTGPGTPWGAGGGPPGWALVLSLCWQVLQKPHPYQTAGSPEELPPLLASGTCINVWKRKRRNGKCPCLKQYWEQAKMSLYSLDEIFAPGR